MLHVKKPRITIAGLEARIATLQELRDGDRITLNSHKSEIAKLQEELKRTQSAAQHLERDKQWLKQLIQNLSVPSQERTRF